MLSEHLQDDLLDTSNEEEGENPNDEDQLSDRDFGESGVYGYPHDMGTGVLPTCANYQSNNGEDNDGYLLPRQSPQQHVETIHPPSNEVSEVSNVFNGTSQEYSQMMDANKLANVSET